jgi:hypothetical protein
MAIEKKVDVAFNYSKDRIHVKGKGVELFLQVSSSELSKVYWGGNGKGILKLTVEEDAE